MRTRRVTALLVLLGGMIVGSCAHDTPLPTESTGATEALLAKGGGSGSGTTLYKLRFISGVNPAGDGEIASDWFPASGISINDKNPWGSISINPATLNLVNSTHGSWSIRYVRHFSGEFSATSQPDELGHRGDHSRALVRGCMVRLTRHFRR